MKNSSGSIASISVRVQKSDIQQKTVLKFNLYFRKTEVIADNLTRRTSGF